MGRVLGFGNRITMRGAGNFVNPTIHLDVHSNGDSGICKSRLQSLCKARWRVSITFSNVFWKIELNLVDIIACVKRLDILREVQ